MRQLAGLLLILTLTGTAGAAGAEREQAVAAPSAAPSNELKVGVKGMVCAFCAQGIEKKFKAQKEVAGIEVSLQNKYIKLKFKDGQRLDDKKIAELLKEAGYDADFGVK